MSLAPEDAQSIPTKAADAFDLGADYVEIRFDFLKPEILHEAVDACKKIKDKAVFTLRSKDQGGKFIGSEQQRFEWLQILAHEKPMLLDVELDTLQQNDELADFLERQKNPILVSWHDFNETPTHDKLADILSDMRVYSNYVKVVTTAKSVNDSIRLLELYDTAIGLQPIFFAMGEAGVISRVLCPLHGAPFTYASLDNVVAPGQLTIKQMRQLYQRLRV